MNRILVPLIALSVSFGDIRAIPSPGRDSYSDANPYRNRLPNQSPTTSPNLGSSKFFSFCRPSTLIYFLKLEFLPLGPPPLYPGPVVRPDAVAPSPPSRTKNSLRSFEMEKGGIWAAEVENSFAKEPSERFLTSSLFSGIGLIRHRQNWNVEDELRWRSTTKAPYFENKFPGSDDFFSAASVIGEIEIKIS
jgi:hypothetical protein